MKIGPLIAISPAWRGDWLTMCTGYREEIAARREARREAARRQPLGDPLAGEARTKTTAPDDFLWQRNGEIC